jgi:hypothetical protein
MTFTNPEQEHGSYNANASREDKPARPINIEYRSNVDAASKRKEDIYRENPTNLTWIIG